MLAILKLVHVAVLSYCLALESALGTGYKKFSSENRELSGSLVPSICRKREKDMNSLKPFSVLIQQNGFLR